MLEDINELRFTLTSLQNAYDNGLRPEELITEVYRRIDAVDDPGIFIHLLSKLEVLDAANALPPRVQDLPLWGIPFVVKDNMDLKGTATTAACPSFAYDPDTDAYVVERLKKLGGLLIGKTNLDQFATGLAGLRSPYNPPRNAVDPEIVPGGSSSGSAVAVAHGFVCFSLGTDTAGSVRVPAALNNIVGIKPTLGAISSRGIVPACRTLDTVGILALTVDDAYSVYQNAVGFDPEDAFSRRIEAPAVPKLPIKIRLVVPDRGSLEFFGDELQANSFSNTIELLRQNGACIKEIDFQPFYDVAQMLYDGPWMAERFTVVEKLLKEQPNALHPITAKLIGSAKNISAAEAFRGLYRLKELARRVEPILENSTVLCVPSIPTFYTVDDLASDPVGPASKLGTYTNFVNLLDMCGLTIPVSSRADGRPGSITLLAVKESDAQLASLGRWIEHLAPHNLGGTSWTHFSTDELKTE